ncbi:HIT family protein [Candidatus Nomurabacteria bacterium]|nr:HIT family protein [Candidatus Nomurabacteria bacterium]USN94743.1 MAG: HIT family protein [Candidatus Nomurabacteria bacterium]
MENNDNCVFCKIISGEYPSFKIYEDNDLVSFLVIEPINDGHALVVPKKHFENIFETPEETLSKILPVAKNLSQKIMKAVDATGINIVQNNGKDSGQEIMHYHLHIIPRFETDGLKPWHHTKKSPEDLAPIAEKINSIS